MAAFAEIYDMLEEVCFTYDLPGAFTWTCVAKVNEIMSDSAPYIKPLVSLQTSFCYWMDLGFRDFIGEVRELKPQAGQGIACKALQSSQHFHFQQSIRENYRFSYSYPRSDRFPKGAAVAICLQNNYNGNVYVVEFFLSKTETQLEDPKSLALGIFNHLKNMKKNFVKVRVELQQVLNEQVPYQS